MSGLIAVGNVYVRFEVRLLSIAFLSLALAFGAGVIVDFPSGEGPDEVAHIARAESLSHGFMAGRRLVETDGRPDAGVIANLGIYGAIPIPLLSIRSEGMRFAAAEQARLRAATWASGLQYISVLNTATYPPQFYVASALGIAAARAVGFPPWTALRLARTANLLSYVVCGAVALAIARVGHTVLLTTLLLPMSVFLAGTLNQDGPLIAASVLAAALLTRCGATSLVTSAVLLSLLAAAKPVYLPLVLLLCLGLAPIRTRLIAMVAAGIPPLLWFLAMRRWVAVPLRLPEPYVSGPLWPGPALHLATAEPSLQLRVLMHEPVLLVWLPLKAMSETSRLCREMVGTLAEKNVMLPEPLYDFWYFVVVMAIGLACMPRWFSDAGGRGQARRVPGRLLTAASSVSCCVVLIALSQYLAWTPLGADHIDGVQGRYLIPLLPFLITAVRPDRARLSPRAMAAFLILITATSVVSLYATHEAAHRAYAATGG